MLRASGEDSVVHIEQLALGALLAEGGEGRVFEVECSPVPLVYKQFRHPQPASLLARAVSFPDRLENGYAARVRAASAWPIAVVVGDDPGEALGALMPRAPAAFWLRHREGGPRLATLSYLTSDPDRITVAYGVVVPAPGAPERVGVVYALARLLEAWDGHGAGGVGAPASARSRGPAGPAGDEHGAGGAYVVHGDLSAKNVLWSLDPVPAVYVLDCDGVSVLGAGEGSCRQGCDGEAGDGVLALQDAAPVRATTPNWDDPAHQSGGAPEIGQDRYALGLAFLRVVGAAHFPLQGRQRLGEKISVDLEVPRSWRRLPDMPRLWELCERSLSVAAAKDRPRPAEWGAELEQLLTAMGSASLAATIRVVQGDPRSSTSLEVHRGAGRQQKLVTVPDVEVRPVSRHRQASSWALVNAAGPSQGAGAGEGLAGIGLATGLSLRDLLRRIAQAWAGAHRLALGLLRSRGRRRDGLRRLVRVLAADLAAACLVLFLVGMIVSPWIGL